MSDLARVLDLGASLVTGEATVRGAIARRETRGCHNRSDFPHLDPELQVNLYTRLDSGSGRLTLWSEPVPPVPEELRQWAENASDPDPSGRLLE